MRTVAIMLPICATLARIAAMDAKRLKENAAVCKDCEDECRKHEKQHAECKACAESCAAWIVGMQENDGCLSPYRPRAVTHLDPATPGRQPGVAGSLCRVRYLVN